MKNMTRGAVLILLLAAVTGCGMFKGRHRQEDFYFGSYSEGEALFKQKKYEQALSRYQAYIDENPEGNLSVIARYYMAKCYVGMGKKDEAKEIFQKIQKEHPDLVWANFSEAQLKELSAPAVPASK